MDFATADVPVAVATGDVNGDGRVDFAVANRNPNSVWLYLGGGDGTFGPRADLATDSGPRAVESGDLNGDGIPDLVVASLTDWTVSVLLGTGGGAFARGPITSPQRSLLGGDRDLNGNGRPDVVVANNGSGSVSVFLGNGSGGLAPKVDYPIGGSAWSAVIGT